MFSRKKIAFITAVGTPVDVEGKLVEKSFRLHLNDQLRHGIDGMLVMGSMGMMPCLLASTYLKCVQTAVAEIGRRARIMVGVGRNSIEQTMEKIESLKNLEIDAVVATTPYYFPSSQEDLIYYFTEVANRSFFPLYLYDLPQITKVKIELETVLKLSRHGNIHGIKCSHDPAYTKTLFDRLSESGFEIITAHYDLIDKHLLSGITTHLDGFFSVIPAWLKQMKDAFNKREFETITQIQKKMTALRDGFTKVGVCPAFTVAMNLLGFEGRFHPSHLCSLDESRKAQVKKLLKECGLLG